MNDSQELAFTATKQALLLSALKARDGHWMKVRDLMFLAGFIVHRKDQLTAFTSFYWHLERLKDLGRREGFSIHREDQHVMLSTVAA